MIYVSNAFSLQMVDTNEGSTTLPDSFELKFFKSYIGGLRI